LYAVDEADNQFGMIVFFYGTVCLLLIGNTVFQRKLINGTPRKILTDNIVEVSEVGKVNRISRDVFFI
jgi:hypothetical protein